MLNEAGCGVQTKCGGAIGEKNYSWQVIRPQNFTPGIMIRRPATAIAMSGYSRVINIVTAEVAHFFNEKLTAQTPQNQGLIVMGRIWRHRVARGIALFADEWHDIGLPKLFQCPCGISADFGVPVIAGKRLEITGRSFRFRADL